jgi:F0F1-type ATP synthase assembly protein I
LNLQTGARSRAPPRSTARAEAEVTHKEPNKVTAWRQIGLLSSIPFILALAPIVGYFLGKFLDQKFRTQPWLSFILLILGFVAGVRETINIVKMSQSED